MSESRDSHCQPPDDDLKPHDPARAGGEIGEPEPGAGGPAAPPHATTAVRGLGGTALADAAVVAVVLAAVNALAVWWVASEQTLYHADRVAWWSFARSLASTLAEDPWAAMVGVSSSVAHNTLNLLPVVPLAPLLLLFGDSRLAFVLTVVNAYGLATLVAFVATSRCLAGATQGRRTAASSLALLLVLVLFATVWQPVLLGYVGLGGVALAFSILLLYLHREATAQSLLRLIAIGVLVGLLALFRRWWGFWSLAFCALVVVEAGVLLVRRRAPWRDCLRAPTLIGLSAALTVAAVALPMALDVLGTDWAGKLVAFKFHSTVASELGGAVHHFGIVLLAVIAISAISLARSRRRRRLPVFALAHMIIVYLAFRRLQDPNIHHWWLYAPAMMTLVGVAVLDLEDRLRGRIRPLAIGGLALLAGLAAAGNMPGPVGRALASASPMTGEAVHPRVRGDIDVMIRLLATLDNLIAERPGYVYVLGRGDVISDQIIGFANLSLGSTFRSPRFVLSGSHVDTRDGFPCLLPEATYMVVALPLEDPDEPFVQKVNAIPARCLVTRQALGRAFQRLTPVFRLDRDTKAILFRRTRPPTTAEIAELSDMLRAYYPDQPAIWEPCQ